MSSREYCTEEGGGEVSLLLYPKMTFFLATFFFLLTVTPPAELNARQLPTRSSRPSAWHFSQHCTQVRRG